MATLRYQTERLDGDSKLLPWYTAGNAWDHHIRTLWDWLPDVPNYAGYPMYYLTCAFTGPGTPIQPSTWENDWGEKVPNITEFARLYYAYSGDTAPLTIAAAMMDYAIEHGRSASNHSWPNMLYGTANAGETTIDGNNTAWSTQYSLLVDLAADMGMAAYRLYQLLGTAAYRTAATDTADCLASKIVAGSATISPWRYVVNSYNGNNVTGGDFCSNWAGAMTLFDLLIEANDGSVANYTTARTTLKNWLLGYPLNSGSAAYGRWVSAHSDNNISGYTNKCNTTKSNMCLYLLDNPTFDPNHSTNIPALLQWTETNMVAVTDIFGTYNPTGVYRGAHVPCEQTVYLARMGYQAARLGAEYARWYLTSGNATHADIAYRNFNYNTYMMQSDGLASDGPNDQVGWWFGDCYGEAPRMYFHGMAGLPQYAPTGENHILYSRATLTNVAYGDGTVQYTPANAAGTEYLKTNFQPGSVTVGSTPLSLGSGYTVSSLGGGDYAVTVTRSTSGAVVVAQQASPPTGTITLSVR